jgi:acyl dehydratase
MTFGCLTGDYAQMHFDHTFGPGAGMGGTIAHGLLSAAWSLGILTREAPQRLAIGDPQAWLAGLRVKFGRMVFIGDRLSLRWTPGQRPGVDGLDALATLDTDFEVINQRGEVTGGGTVSVCGAGGTETPLPRPPELMPLERWSSDGLPRPAYAEDLVAGGPRGESLGRTVTEADTVGFANFTGELNPLYCNEVFARETRFGGRIVPPMLSFCFGFSGYLQELLSVEMPSAGFAGHLGDSWRFFAPLRVGDTVRVRHRPVDCVASRSRPGMAVVRFSLQMLNQRDEVVQDGEVAMMMPSHGDA